MGPVLPLIFGAGGLVGIGGLIATFYLLRSQRDNNIATAARQLVEGSSSFNTELQEELKRAREEIQQLTTKLDELTEQFDRLHDQLERSNRERDQAIRERDKALAKLGGRRGSDR